MAEAPGGAQATEDGSVLWRGLPSFASMRGLETLERSRPQRSSFRNRAAVTRNAPGRSGDDADGFDAMPAPRLSIRRAGFAPDFMWSRLHFAPARFRAALALKSGAIERCGVDVDGEAYVEERPDGADHFTMSMNLRHPILGELFRYSGRFTLDEPGEDGTSSTNRARSPSEGTMQASLRPAIRYRLRATKP